MQRLVEMHIFPSSYPRKSSEAVIPQQQWAQAHPRFGFSVPFSHNRASGTLRSGWFGLGRSNPAWVWGTLRRQEAGKCPEKDGSSPKRHRNQTEVGSQGPTLIQLGNKVSNDRIGFYHPQNKVNIQESILIEIDNCIRNYFLNWVSRWLETWRLKNWVAAGEPWIITLCDERDKTPLAADKSRNWR